MWFIRRCGGIYYYYLVLVVCVCVCVCVCVRACVCVGGGALVEIILKKTLIIIKMHGMYVKTN
jgi:hypothetical protein